LRGIGAFITGVSGKTLTPEERDFLRSSNPWGFILFGRNIGTPGQVAALVASLRESVGRAAPVLIDQEGGRVQRLGPPFWRRRPPGTVYAELYRRDREAGLAAIGLGAQLIGHELQALGIDVDCLPVLDLPVSGADPIIGDRALGRSVKAIVALGRAQMEGLRRAGVHPIIKHIPGHGRADADSHLVLPIVETGHLELSRTDFAPFAALAGQADLAMTAHILYAALDRSRCATFSEPIITSVIREEIGFGGLLMSDDLSMKALGGSFRERAERAIAAGCDIVLHCNGSMEEMEAVAQGAGVLLGAAQARASRVVPLPVEPLPDHAERAFANLLGDLFQSGDDRNFII
jgi:beta-N-acetylhexosaminidase